MKQINPVVSCIHDIKNKLALIDLYSRRLSKKEQLEDALHIQGCVQRIASLLVELNQAIECEGSLANLVPFEDFEKKLLQVLTEINNSYHMKLSLKSKLMDKGFFVKCSQHRMHRVLENIIDNAFRAQAKNVIVTIDSLNSFLTIDFTDDGYIQRETIEEKLELESFEQLPKGLGKQIITENVVALGGLVKWTNHQKDGHSVTVTFPQIKT
jgi:signal transduction histidine kinase